jgi:hypothetical protein
MSEPTNEPLNETNAKIEKQRSNIFLIPEIKRGNFILNAILLFSFSVPIFYIVTHVNKLLSIDSALVIILLSSLMSIVAFAITYRMIPVFIELNKSKGIFGVDINKCDDIKNKNDPLRKEV